MIAEALKKAMRDRGVSSTELARRLGLSDRTFWNHIHGVTKISTNELMLLSEELNIDLNQLRKEYLRELSQHCMRGEETHKEVKEDA